MHKNAEDESSCVRKKTLRRSMRPLPGSRRLLFGHASVSEVYDNNKHMKFPKEVG